MQYRQKILSHWIEAQPVGTLIRSSDLEHLISRRQATRQLSRMAARGRIWRVARGMYVAVTESRFGPVPPPVDRIIQSLSDITGETFVRHGAAAAHALGLTMQAPIRQIYLTNRRARTICLGKQIIEIRRAPGWLLVLGDSVAGDVVRALDWLGPDLAEQAVSQLVERISLDEWRAILNLRRLPAWLRDAIRQRIGSS